MKRRILIVGGIFDKPPEYRAAHRVSPETTLAEGLAREDWDVAVQGHSSPLPRDGVDLVHVHHFGRGAFRMLGRRRTCRFVFTSHDGFLLQEMPRNWKRRLLDPLVLADADGVVALSQRERDFFIQRYHVASSRIEVIPNGVLELFQPDNAPRQPSKDLLFVGQLQAFKGLDWLLQAMPEIRARHPEVRLRLCYQTSALLDYYHLLATRLKITECVLFDGPRPPEQLAELYRSCAVYVHPSLAECLSTVVSEAMLSGACIVATDVGGIREQIDDNSGIVVPPRDSHALASAVCCLLDDPARRRRLGDAARSQAIERFGVPLMISRHIRLYERILQSQQTAREPIGNGWVGTGLRKCISLL